MSLTQRFVHIELAHDYAKYMLDTLLVQILLTL